MQLIVRAAFGQYLLTICTASAAVTCKLIESALEIFQHNRRQNLIRHWHAFKITKRRNYWKWQNAVSVILKEDSKLISNYTLAWIDWNTKLMNATIVRVYNACKTISKKNLKQKMNLFFVQFFHNFLKRNSSVKLHHMFKQTLHIVWLLFLFFLSFFKNKIK